MLGIATVAEALPFCAPAPLAAARRRLQHGTMIVHYNEEMNLADIGNRRRSIRRIFRRETFGCGSRRHVPGGDLAETLYVAGSVQGEILEKILQQCGNDFTRDNIMKQALNLRNFLPSMAIPGNTINTSADNHQAWTSLQLESFDGKNWIPFGKLISTTD